MRLRLVVAGERVQVVEREAAPGGAQDAQPCHAVLGIEQGAGQGERVQHFGAGGKLFQFDGAEGNSGLAQSCGDGGEVAARAAQNGDAKLLCA